jgi:hypothetical protein
MIAARSLPIFAMAFAVLYLLCVEFNWALFTYHPALEEFGFLAQAPKDGPAMYWYGWLATSALGAIVIAALAAWLPESWTRNAAGASLSWAIPMAVMIVFVYILRRYFLR